MTARFKAVSFASDHEIKTRVAQGHYVRRISASEFIVHVEQRHDGARLRQRVKEIEWPGGPASAELIGANLDGSVLFVDLGPMRSKGVRLVDLIEDPPVYPFVPTVRMKRTGRRLSWWAARLVERKREPLAPTETEEARWWKR